MKENRLCRTPSHLAARALTVGPESSSVVKRPVRRAKTVWSAFGTARRVVSVREIARESRRQWNPGYRRRNGEEKTWRRHALSGEMNRSQNAWLPRRLRADDSKHTGGVNA